MYLGKDQKGTVFLTEDARKANLAIFGIKNTGKAYTFIPYLFEQDLCDKNTGITIVVNTPDLAWYLSALAKIKNRKDVVILKPSINPDILNDLLFKEEWNYQEINKFFNYEKAIKERKIVIIDMEEERFGEEAIRATSMLLLQLQSDMVAERKPNIKHSVYIDGASEYLPYIKNLLKYGDYHNFYTTLFFKSRNNIKDTSLIDEYVRNYVLLQGITWEDAKYFGERFGINNPYDAAITLMDRVYGEFAYEIVDKNYRRKVGFGEICSLPKELHNQVLERQEKEKKRNKPIIKEDKHLQLETEKECLKKEDTESYYERMDKDVPRIKEYEIETQEIPTAEDIVVEELEQIPDIEMPNFEQIEVELEDEPKEPQLNKTRKSISIPKKEKDFSMIEDIDLSDIEIDLDEPLEERVPEIIDLNENSDAQEDFILTSNGSKKLPYQRIINKKVKKSLDVLKW